MLALVALALGAVSFGFHHGAGWPGEAGVIRFATARMKDLRDDPAGLKAELQRAREAFGVSVTVWDGNGHLVASSADPPFLRDVAGWPPPKEPVRLRGHAVGWAIPLSDGGVLLAGGSSSPDPLRGFSFIGAVLLALAIGSIPLARSIAAPIERITDAARRLGEGDLDARANVRGRGEVGELGRTFDEAASRLQGLVRAEHELLANVSHELRTPMARIRVALELAAEGDLEKARRHLAGIGADLDELDRLVEDVLAAARLDRMAGSLGGSALPLERAPVDVKGLVSDTVDRFQERNPNRTVEVSVTDDLASVVLLGDSTLLRRLLANLLDNAGKYSEPETPITLRVLRAKEEVSIEISDDGIGIDPEDLPRLFTPFFRTDRSRARGTGGTGLGLALVKRIAEAHGGTVAAESEVGKGTVFRVRLPVRPG